MKVSLKSWWISPGVGAKSHHVRSLTAQRVARSAAHVAGVEIVKSARIVLSVPPRLPIIIKYNPFFRLLSLRMTNKAGPKNTTTARTSTGTTPAGKNATNTEKASPQTTAPGGVTEVPYQRTVNTGEDKVKQTTLETKPVTAVSDGTGELGLNAQLNIQEAKLIIDESANTNPGGIGSRAKNKQNMLEAKSMKNSWVGM